MAGSSLLIISKSPFSKNSFRNTTRVSNRLDLDQARGFVRPDLGPSCLQRLSADNTSSKQSTSRQREGFREGELL